jgi:hypothetical protein
MQKLNYDSFIFRFLCGSRNCAHHHLSLAHAQPIKKIKNPFEFRTFLFKKNNKIH